MHMYVRMKIIMDPHVCRKKLDLSKDHHSVCDLCFVCMCVFRVYVCSVCVCVYVCMW